MVAHNLIKVSVHPRTLLSIKSQRTVGADHREMKLCCKFHLRLYLK